MAARRTSFGRWSLPCRLWWRAAGQQPTDVRPRNRQTLPPTRQATPSPPGTKGKHFYRRVTTGKALAGRYLWHLTFRSARHMHSNGVAAPGRTRTRPVPGNTSTGRTYMVWSVPWILVGVTARRNDSTGHLFEVGVADLIVFYP